MRKVFSLVLAIVTLPLSGNVLAKNEALGHNGMAVSEHKAASKVGIEILKSGGNAVDAAVAMGYALAVLNPCCGNIGGGGFMLLHLTNDHNVFLNFREKAPQKASLSKFQDGSGHPIPNATTRGYLAVGVPGTVMGLDTALKRYGTMKREDVMRPAIQLAREGYKVSAYEAKQLSDHAKDFETQPNITHIFFKDGEPLKEGDRLIQTDLANTLSKIAEKGTKVFYRGSIAKAIVKASKANGGLLLMSDFANYRVTTSRPLECDYHGYTFLTAPPPSSGGVILCEALAVSNHFPLREYGAYSARSVRTITEILRYGFTDRNQLGDPKFIRNPIKALLSDQHIKMISDKIASTDGPTVKNSENEVGYELTDTTHYSVVDKHGNAVSVTYTLNGFFGARVIAGQTGFFLNNEMDDFEFTPDKENKFGLKQSAANNVQPNKQPLSSMTPTIVLKDGKLFMVIGSPGGPRIISTVLLTILNFMEYGMTLPQAVNSPRFHHQAYPDTIFIEPNTISSNAQKALTDLGYHITPQHTWGAIEAILVDPKEKVLHGVNDMRRPDGGAVGY